MDRPDAPTPGSPLAPDEAGSSDAPDEAGSSDATPASPAPPKALDARSPAAPDELEAWLVENVEAERRAAVRGAADCLDDLQGCDLEDLDEALELQTWPAPAREKFLDAWHALNKDDAPSSTMRDMLAARAAAARQPSTEEEIPEESDEDAPAPKQALRGAALGAKKKASHYRSKACEVRCIGDPEWRTFMSRADAARAFPGLPPRKRPRPGDGRDEARTARRNARAGAGPPRIYRWRAPRLFAADL